jgi:caffeoyl-CoA O-methyltransferase
VIDPDVERYVAEHTTAPPPWLEELERETRAASDAARMLTGRVEGRLLETLVWATGARRVLEIGTFTGYSALAMAAALPDGGRVITCELDAERAAFAQRHVDASPYADRIEIRVGPALDTIRALDGELDLVFVDADKEGYPDYFEATLPLLAPRGLMVLDNTLRFGSVMVPAGEQDERARIMSGLNDRLATDPRVVATMLSVRDGVTLVRRAT